MDLAKDDAYYSDSVLKRKEGALSSDPGNSSSVAGSVNSVDNMNSDLLYHDENDVGDDGDYADDGADYDDNDDYLYEYDYLKIQSHFDNVDLPPGVEASLPWLNEPSLSKNTASSTNTSTVSDVSKASSSDNVEAKMMAAPSCLSENTSGAASASSSEVPAESSSNGEVEESGENGIMQKFMQFKQFDTVEDFSDHHYSRMGFSEQQPPKSWAKRIQEEWKSLEKDLPETIFVRVYESRMELLRAVIVGPCGTPYHDGIFVFDCLFPTDYPNAPPMVYYYSGGLRLNPNLYDCGKVCLSLLGTWSGDQNEMWMPGKSTMLQVLVSIQALILNVQPFFNEPGYMRTYVGEEGERRSKKYSEDVFILSLKTMMYTLRRPPKYFEDFVIGHFHSRAHDILVACKAYLEGAIVGTVLVKEGVADLSNAERSSSDEFRSTLRKTVNFLITNFARFASVDCEQFRIDE